MGQLVPKPTARLEAQSWELRLHLGGN